MENNELAFYVGIEENDPFQKGYRYGWENCLINLTILNKISYDDIEIKEVFDNPLFKKYIEFFRLQYNLLKYGEEKHKEDSFQQLVSKPGFTRTFRLNKAELAEHSNNHFIEYLMGKPHGHFKNLDYQLAAVAVNSMMEYVIRSYGK